MESNSYFGFDLAAAARIVRRMSFFTLANSFLVGTCFNSLFLASLSIGVSR
jgi:hypothetical protein